MLDLPGTDHLDQLAPDRSGVQSPPRPPQDPWRRSTGGGGEGMDPELEALLRYTCICLTLLLLAWMIHSTKRAGLWPPTRELTR